MLLGYSRNDSDTIPALAFHKKFNSSAVLEIHKDSSRSPLRHSGSCTALVAAIALSEQF